MVTGQRVTELMTNSHKENINKKLSIQVRLDGLSFFTQNLDTLVIEHYENRPFATRVDPLGLTQELETLYAESDILKAAYQKVTVVYVNSLFTFVPKAVFNEDFLADYLKFNTKILATDYIAYDILEEQDIVCVYVPYTNCNNLFFGYYGSFDYHHSMSLLAQKTLSSNSKRDEHPKVLINVQESSFEIIVHQNKELLLVNSFEFTTKEDFIYYLLFTMEQLALDPETVPVALAGNISKESPLFEMVYTYIRDVSITQKEYTPIAIADYTSTTLL